MKRPGAVEAGKEDPLARSAFPLGRLCLPIQQVLDGRGVPLAAACGEDAACIEHVSNVPQRPGSSALSLADDWQHVGSLPCCLGLDDRYCLHARLSELRATKRHTARLG